MDDHDQSREDKLDEVICMMLEHSEVENNQNCPNDLVDISNMIMEWF